MKITRVILVGNSLKQPEVKEEAAIKKPVSSLSLVSVPTHLYPPTPQEARS